MSLTKQADTVHLSFRYTEKEYLEAMRLYFWRSKELLARLIIAGVGFFHGYVIDLRLTFSDDGIEFKTQNIKNQEDSMVDRRIVARVAFVVLPVFAVACMSVFQSSFYSAFSLKELVQKNQSNSGLNCTGSGGAGGGGGGISAGAGGLGGGGSNFHKGESLACQISDAEQFVEARFIQILKESVEKDLDASQAKIVSSKNPDARHFAIEYTVSNSFGRIEISGTRSAGYYSLEAQLDEKSNK
jgi:hypothetical protein